MFSGALTSFIAVEDVNLALAVLNVEKVYGLMDAERQGGSGAHSTGDESVAVVMGQRKVDLGTIRVISSLLLIG